MHCELALSPLSALKVPTAHVLATDEPATQKWPCGQVIHPSTVSRPSVAECVPAEHWVHTEAEADE